MARLFTSTHPSLEKRGRKVADAMTRHSPRFFCYPAGYGMFSVGDMRWCYDKPFPSLLQTCQQKNYKMVYIPGCSSALKTSACWPTPVEISCFLQDRITSAPKFTSHDGVEESNVNCGGWLC